MRLLVATIAELLSLHRKELGLKVLQGFFIIDTNTKEFFDYISLQIHDCFLQEQPFQNRFCIKTK